MEGQKAIVVQFKCFWHRADGAMRSKNHIEESCEVGKKYVSKVFALEVNNG